MYKFLLLFLFAAGLFSPVPAQEKTADITPKSVLSDEVGRTNEEHLWALLDRFLVELYNDPSAQGNIINYGSDREILILENSILKFLRFRGFDASRIVLTRGGFLNERKTQLWVVPAGAENPPLIPAARKIDEFGKLNQNALRARIGKIRDALQKDLAETDTVYIIYQIKNNAEAKRVEAAVRNYLFENCRGCFGLSPRFTMVRDDKAKTSKVQFWIVPKNAEMPLFYKSE